MSASTNKLVTAATKHILLPATVLGAFALGGAFFAEHGSVHAAMLPGSFAAATPIDDNSVAALTALDRAMEAVTARVTPSIVNVEVTSRATPEETSDDEQQQQQLPPGIAQFFGQGGGLRMQPQQPQIEHGVGSGVILSPDGYIVTNDHVVAGATKIRVTLSDRRTFSGKVIGIDKMTDLAVIKIDAKDLRPIAWGDSSKLEPGQTVLAFGSPFGSLRFSVTRGIVSAINRANPFNDDGRKPGDYIQTDAAINPGNSGGALVNAHGELIGINQSIITSPGSGSFSGAGFAIPSQTVQATTQQLIAHGKVDHGYLGISMNDVTPDNAQFFNLKEASGAIVAQVTPDSPAGHAGLKQGDVITSLNGRAILNGSEIQIAVSQMSPGTKLQLGILRNGQSTTIPLTTGEYHAKGELASNSDGQDQQPGHTGKLGLAVADLNADARQQLNAPDDLHGVIVQNVRPASPADDAGLQPGDVILEVNRKPAASASQFLGEVHQTPAGKDLLLLVWSKGNASYRTLHPADQNG